MHILMISGISVFFPSPGEKDSSSISSGIDVPTSMKKFSKPAGTIMDSKHQVTKLRYMGEQWL